MTGTIDGKTLIAMGFAPGAWFGQAIEAARKAAANGASTDAIRDLVQTFAPPPLPPQMALKPADTTPILMNITAEVPGDAENIAQVRSHMQTLARVPTVEAAAVMPDACVSGHQPGTIPVGGVVATRNAIHPGMHSADICCSMAVTMFPADTDPKRLVDAGMTLSHFGGGGRPRGQQVRPPSDVMERFEANRFLKPLVSAGIEHFATQGDGNHFYYVGRVASSGQIALVTHHGSRKPGAMLYKTGMFLAEKIRAAVSPETGAQNAWLIADSDDGAVYWEALQTIRAWTKANHYAIHDRVAEGLGLKPQERFWNEHNFVFQKSDGLFYHAKGATPAYPGFAADTNGLTLIPLNMAEPILIARGKNAPNALGFAPHGAGRNLSRSAYMRQNAGKTVAELVAEQTRGIDARFFCGVPDASELPGAYKNAAQVRRQIDAFGLAEVVDTIEPLGSIMAGDWQVNAPWRNKRAAKTAAAAASR